jgi:endonuclease/exonuclease/phosphatase family metal-dependent hydrolase
MIALLVWGGGLAGCGSAFNYTGPDGPRYAEVAAPLAGPAPDAIRLVTFNIKFARQIDSAIALLGSVAPLASADILTLQEMDASGTRRIARALGMSYVYYPATVHPSTGRDFGNAILSRWPIVDDAKIVLPHLSRFGGIERIATAATIRVGTALVRVYSVHLGTWVEEGPGARRDQVRAILADGAGYQRVIVGGDMNNHGIGKAFRAAGYDWPTERNPHTDHFWNWDHIFLRGFTPSAGSNTGVIRENHHSSDHRPVWAIVSLSASTVSAPAGTAP